MNKLFDLFVGISLFPDGMWGWVHPHDSKFERIRGRSYRTNTSTNIRGKIPITRLQYNSGVWLNLNPDIKIIIDQIKIDVGDI